MTDHPLLTLALAVWFGLWLLRDTGHLGVRRSAAPRRLARHSSDARAVRQTFGQPPDAHSYSHPTKQPFHRAGGDSGRQFRG